MIIDLNRPDHLSEAAKWRAWLNDEEVTDRCFYADDERGVVRLYRLNENGQKFIEHGSVATEEVHGHVRLVPVSA